MKRTYMVTARSGVTPDEYRILRWSIQGELNWAIVEIAKIQDRGDIIVARRDHRPLTLGQRTELRFLVMGVVAALSRVNWTMINADT